MNILCRVLGVEHSGYVAQHPVSKMFERAGNLRVLLIALWDNHDLCGKGRKEVYTSAVPLRNSSYYIQGPQMRRFSTPTRLHGSNDSPELPQCLVRQYYFST
jgi:hypothetical protein